jgi:outer membrane lipoprotein LolB
MHGPSLKLVTVVAAAMLVGACTTLPRSPATESSIDRTDSPFSISGRISARRGDAGIAGSFTWVHDATHDAIDLSSPLGQTLARLEGDAEGVTVLLPDGRSQSAPTWSELTQRAFGVTIPVDGLAAWIRAFPRAGSPSRAERDDRGRVASLRQLGWDIVYAYADDAAVLPFRASLTYPGADVVEVRVVVDHRD